MVNSKEYSVKGDIRGMNFHEAWSTLSLPNIADSDVIGRILYYIISICNNKYLVHNNPILNYDESILIFNSLSSTVKFIQRLEEKQKNSIIEDAKPK
jgi:hypothetical protein